MKHETYPHAKTQKIIIIIYYEFTLIKITLFISKLELHYVDNLASILLSGCILCLNGIFCQGGIWYKGFVCLKCTNILQYRTTQHTPSQFFEIGKFSWRKSNEKYFYNEFKNFDQQRFDYLNLQHRLC